ncbi:unnamed protein product [Linum tenue]|uniref:Protein RTE1-HOMOLOG n=1 Tax=Linum tenue TaxID=586396 RepID=A0AAV0I707_9ROSI|nr:unnamed protein product [Linum tenue]
MDCDSILDLLGEILIADVLKLYAHGLATKNCEFRSNSAMGENVDPEQQRILDENFSGSLQIDPKRARFPNCIVWTPLPVISWLIPFIGHVGICREDGVILDFAGPNFVCVDNFAFGAVTRYIQINKEKDALGKEGSTWDNALRKGTQEFQHHAYSLFTCNCHSFVANNLNRLGFQSGGWNVVNVALLVLIKGQWVSTGAMLKSYLPFVIVTGFGIIFGGITFLTFLAFFMVLLVGWFILATYCFKDFIQL